MHVRFTLILVASILLVFFGMFGGSYGSLLKGEITEIGSGVGVLLGAFGNPK